MKKLLILVFLTISPATIFASEDTEVVLQLIDYVGVDYPEAVAQGRIINEAEYQEMLDFSKAISEMVGRMPESEGKPSLREESARLSDLIAAKQEAALIRASTQNLRKTVMTHYPVNTRPNTAPDIPRGALLYREQCAACHGAQGMGDGQLATGLEPPPTDFTDRARARQRSLYGLFNTITLGVDETAMTAFSHLPASDRWALAFYASGLHLTQQEIADGKSAFAAGGDVVDSLSIDTLTTVEPAELADPASNIYAYLRTAPGDIFTDDKQPVEFAITQLRESLNAYRSNEREQAYKAAVQAYLEGFELIEAGLSNIDYALLLKVEAQFVDYRNAIRRGAPLPEVTDKAEELENNLLAAKDILASGGLSPSVAFASALIILSREGLEAILILGAIAAFMLKTGRRDALPYLHFGWISALLLGVVTWIVSNHVISISGATRELTEGITALFAAVVLFYVGFWMHNKLNAQRWNKFIQEKIQTALDKQALWTLTLVSFAAVYREVFETVLFYQALWGQVGESGKPMILGGFGTAAVLLVVVAWLIFKYSVRIPLRQFFAISAIIMFVLSFIFVGKGVIALQEAGYLPVSPIPLPRIDLLGIYPSLQSFGMQLALVAFATVLVLYNRRSPA
ncbi:MAG: cytochrome c/FTR1 family iron permease [Gammaproteobacteria bacterium]|nr:cytochrome c/FTR1 family iron permease [Gammaproteobacteria bacterium]